MTHRQHVETRGPTGVWCGYAATTEGVYRDHAYAMTTTELLAEQILAAAPVDGAGASARP